MTTTRISYMIIAYPKCSGGFDFGTKEAIANVD